MGALICTESRSLGSCFYLGRGVSVDRATSNEKKDLKSLFCVGMRNEAGFVCGEMDKE